MMKATKRGKEMTDQETKLLNSHKRVMTIQMRTNMMKAPNLKQAIINQQRTRMLKANNRMMML